ncbi:helix-turn-helix domain-containing protein [Mycobacterium sp. 1245801.1]|uniref:helix-turn-helix domain-containing protein n=1 Tax=Mycobacterium sp. 1245801.1 TaxID=1834075 RepID=UPI000A5BB3F7|nr:helix-turn-helix domain-containing protein [Mycobacterium sp. 1245801.1]
MSGTAAPARVVMEPELLSKKDAAQALAGMSTRELDRYVRRGAITPRMLGSRVVFTRDEVRRFATELPTWEPK